VAGAARLRLDRLLFPDPVAAGLNPFVLFSLAYLYRSSNDDADPITVTRERDDLYRIRDGRHRAMASMIAGRKTVLAVIE
jgi:hypothetical protein